MSEKSLSDTLGIDQAAEEALARADVRTLRELSEADPEALAMASGIPLDRIKDWQQRARRAGARKRRNPVATGWMVAIVGLAIAVVLGWILMSIGSRRMQQATQIRREAESKLEMEVNFGARRAMDELRPVRLALHNSNWGAAGDGLSPAEDCVKFIERIAPGRMESDVRTVTTGLEKLQGAIQDQSKEAMDRLTDLEAALDALARAE
jgi:type II secretory pathway pseudopilin PulG